ncbi:MAG: sporulation integral membrane protein YtvI [Clostridia bacterium]|nr:sporulation integral membrane protein YtvI [Clostridia bacterium]
MTASVERRKGVLINVAYFALIVGAFYLFMRFAFWPLFPFIFAFFAAMLLQKPVRLLTKRTPIKKGLAAFLLTMFCALFLIGILALAGTKIVTEVKGLVESVISAFDSLPDFIMTAEKWLISLVEKLPTALETPLTRWIDNLADNLIAAAQQNPSQPSGSLLSGFKFDLSSLKTPLSGVISTASKVPSILIAIVITFIATVFITSDYDRIVTFIKRQLPSKKRETLTKTKNLTITTVSKMLKAYCLIICITCTELFIGLSALKLLGIYNGGYIFTIALVTAIVDIFPILGSGTILIPWGIVSLLMGKTGLGIGVLVIYVIITVLRQYIEPKLVAGQLGLPPIATLMGMYIGLKLFGVLGMFILPFTITILKVLNDDGVIRIWRTARPAKAEEGHSSVELKKFSQIKPTMKRKQKERKNKQ